ncbi:T9SS C-terminal target domain-containing protein, partial [Weeksellaceae bacterium A-14]
GNIERQLILGGVGSDEVESILATADGGCLLGIYSTSGKYEGLVPEKVRYMEFTTGISSDRGEEKAEDTKEPEEIHYYAKQSDHYGIGDYWIVKIDKSGNVEWEKDFGGSGDDHIRTLTRTSYGYVVGGESRSETSGNKRTGLKEGTDLWLLALDENGEEMWQKSYDYSTRDILMSLKNIETKDGETKGLLIGGYSQAEGAKKKEDYAFWMVYTDKEGQEQWRKIVEGTSRKAEERLVSAEMTVDGQYILAGTSAEESGKELWKVVKLGDK